ncbi:alpha/beta hydrolase [Calycomorphotria hydatis]|uniref:2-succinyl-6-hydroxy-2, 4-cyclohexadiene-1-carboxylate synthase n=1 Tax=Calycomorphotria hydatis TaxID=2528027 RepID=A0A517TB42_9PLAN|nr:alpha/beta hydrolase [Calycomorphotria hydatis]QDT65585.1 2-succinyl-6-hydroxy-2,4-cyclohexadiene-1-carboxylate synthase [Calycomorphotria hydatis]
MSHHILARPAQMIERLAVYYNWGPAIPFPRSRDVPFEDVRLTAEDGTELHGRFYPMTQSPEGQQHLSWPTVLFFHGNAGTVRRWKHIAPRWQDAIGADVFVLDYRGYGQSAGSPSEAGFYQDSRAAYDWLINERKTVPEQLIIAGQSLGGGVAVELAVNVPHAALILESTFTSLGDVATHLCPWLPVRGLMRNWFPSLQRLEGYDRPLFISHGTADWLIPVDHARELIDAAARPGGLFLIGGMGHHDHRTAEYGQRVAEFLQQCGVISPYRQPQSTLL